MNRQQITTAVAALAISPFALAGCASPASGFEELVPPAVEQSDAHIVDSYVSTSTSLGGTGFWVRIYLDETSDDALISAVGAALESAYRASPSRPTHITLDVAAAPKPDKVSLSDRGLALDDAVIGALDLQGRVADDSIRLSAAELEKRYGPWEAEK